LIADLLELLEKSDARADKATSLIEQLLDDKAGLRDECDELKEEAVGWKNLHEKSRALGKELKSLIEELMDDWKKLRIERELQVEESVAAVEQSHEDVKKKLEELLA
jgi:siderophore synthetase component